MAEVRRMRERDGAFGWFLARDPSDEERHVETFMAESWLDYLRQLDRMTRDDHATLARALLSPGERAPGRDPFDRGAPRLARWNEERGIVAPASCGLQPSPILFPERLSCRGLRHLS